MLDFSFSDSLTSNRFSWSNYFVVRNPIAMGITYPEEIRDVPVIMRSGRHPNGELKYTEEVQFAGRSITNPKLKEILEVCPIIIKVTMGGGGGTYFAGKGFLGYKELDGTTTCLFITLCDKDSSSISDMKLVASRDIFAEKHKRVANIVMGIGDEHTGDWIETSQMNKYLGQRLALPQFSTIRERKEYINQLVVSCLGTIRESIHEPRVAVAGPRR